MTQETLSVTHTYTSKRLAELAMHNSTDVDAMLSTAKNLHHQGCLPIYERISVLQKLAELVNNEHEALSKLIANEGCKPIHDARVEVTRAVGGIHIAIREMQDIKGDQRENISRSISLRCFIIGRDLRVKHYQNHLSL